jgi:surface antigen
MAISFTRVVSLCALSALMVGTAPAGAIEVGKTPAAQSEVLAAQDEGERRSGGGVLGNIFGCEARGSKQEIGAGIGGVAGGLLGNRIAGRGSRTLGTLLGGALGAAAGSVLGCKLQKNDQVKAERALERAVATNQSQTWQSEESGASGRVDVSQPANDVAFSDLKFARGVEPANGYSKVGGAFVSTSTANIRSAPGTNAPILGKLSAGQSVWVPVSVKGTPWLLISNNGVGQGYVSSALLKRAPASNVAASNCKLVTQTIAVPGAREEAETYQACKGADGQWAMTRV